MSEDDDRRELLEHVLSELKRFNERIDYLEPELKQIVDMLKGSGKSSPHDDIITRAQRAMNRGIDQYTATSHSER
jgi:hypothetical protein